MADSWARSTESRSIFGTGPATVEDLEDLIRDMSSDAPVHIKTGTGDRGEHTWSLSVSVEFPRPRR
jgi:hypothetical protein